MSQEFPITPLALRALARGATVRVPLAAGGAVVLEPRAPIEGSAEDAPGADDGHACEVDAAADAAWCPACGAPITPEAEAVHVARLRNLIDTHSQGYFDIFPSHPSPQERAAWLRRHRRAVKRALGYFERLAEHPREVREGWQRLTPHPPLSGRALRLDLESLDEQLAALENAGDDSHGEES